MAKWKMGNYVDSISDTPEKLVTFFFKRNLNGFINLYLRVCLLKPRTNLHHKGDGFVLIGEIY